MPSSARRRRNSLSRPLHGLFFYADEGFLLSGVQPCIPGLVILEDPEISLISLLPANCV